MMDSSHCTNNKADRKLGEFWEREFCKLAAWRGKTFTPLQIGRNGSAVAYSRSGHAWNVFTLPDIVVWTHPGEHHEIKHKNPTRNGKFFGLEVYRFEALLSFAQETKQDVLYTIHNWSLAGGRDIKESLIEHWFTANVTYLDGRWSYESDRFPSYVNGKKRSNVPQYFWKIGHWQSLENYWRK